MVKPYTVPTLTTRRGDFRTYASEADAHNAACDLVEELQDLAKRYGARIVFSVALDHEGQTRRHGLIARIGDEEDAIAHIIELYKNEPDAMRKALHRIAGNW